MIMCWTTYKSNNCMNFVELWRSPQSESSVTRKLLLNEDSSCRTVVSPLPPSPTLSRASALQRKLELFPAPIMTALTVSHLSQLRRISCSSQKRGKPTPLYCVYAWRFHFVPPWLFYWIFFSQQSLDARGSNRNKEEQRRKTIGGSIKR